MSDSIFKLTEKTGYASPFGNWLAQTPTIGIVEIGAFIVVENNVEIIKIEYAVTSNIDIKNALVRLCTQESEARKVKGVEMRINVTVGRPMDNIFFISIARTVYESHLNQTNPLYFFLEVHHEGKVYTSLDFDLMWLVELSGDRVYNPSSANNKTVASDKLSKDEREELIEITRDRLNYVYTDYVDASGEVFQVIREALKARIEFAFFLADIALGILLPFAGKLVSSLVTSIPSNASNSSFIKALKSLDEPTTTKLLLSGTKVGQKMLQTKFSKLTNIDQKKAFLAQLKIDTRNGFETTGANLPNLSDQEIATIYLSFDSSLVNALTWEEVISDTVERFEKQIMTIGKTKDTISTVPQVSTNYTTGVQWMEYEPKKLVLTNLTFVNKGASASGDKPEAHIVFNTFVDEDLGKLAEKIGNSVQPNGVRTIKNSKIKFLLDNNLLINYPKSVPSGKYLKTTN